MIKKKFALKTLLPIFLGVSIISAVVMDPNTRMQKIRDIFTKYPADAFQILNGHDFGGTGGSEETKVSQQSQRSEIAAVIHSEDPNSFLFCVCNSKWAVYQPDPMKVDTDAMTMTDADGKPFVATQIEAIKRLPNGQARSGGKATVRYTALTPDGRKEQREAIIWNSENLLSRKNATGEKFYCGTSIKVDAAAPAR